MFGKYPGAYQHRIATLSYKFRKIEDCLNLYNDQNR